MLTKTGEGIKNEAFSDGKKMLIIGCNNFISYSLICIVASEY